MRQARYWKLLLLLLMPAFAAVAQAPPEREETITLEEGLEVPLGPCMDINRTLFGAAVDAKALCQCLVRSMFVEIKDPRSLTMIGAGKMDELPADQRELVKNVYLHCLRSAATNDTTTLVHITPNVEAGIRKGLKRELGGTEFETTNDMEQYCDCMIKGLKETFTAGDMAGTSPDADQKSERLHEQCGKASLKK